MCEFFYFKMLNYDSVADMFLQAHYDNDLCYIAEKLVIVKNEIYTTRGVYRLQVDVIVKGKYNTTTVDVERYSMSIFCIF